MDKTTIITLLVALTLTESLMAQPWAPSTPASRLVSTEKAGEGKYYFRIYAPEARQVAISGDFLSWGGKMVFVRDTSGIWTGLSDVIGPGVYRYNFIVDGVIVSDPKSTRVTESKALLEVEGPNGEFWSVKNVPHGDVREVTYFSTTLNKFRRMHIYTPYSYDISMDTCPVLYLIHGGGDNDAAWPSVGKANFIMDNLLAEGKIVPMIVVMPDGSIADDAFTNDLIKDIIPYVEKKYRVKTGKDNRALAGLSMGGLETLNTGIAHNSMFSYIFPLSTGWFADQAPVMEKAEKLVKDNAEQFNKNVKLFWISMGGQEDIAWKNCQNMLRLFDKYGIRYKYSEKPGGHTWYTWRDNLYTFAPMLFK
jgi:enterochelin esterase-like enzyme